MEIKHAIHCQKVYTDETVCEECELYSECTHETQADIARLSIFALEKQIPKKPEKKPDRYCDLIQQYYCPSCGRYFGQRGVHNVILFNKERYCQGDNCGQKIDWSE